MQYRMIMKGNRLTNRLGQCLESYMEMEVSGRNLPEGSQENMGRKRGANSMGMGYSGKKLDIC